MDLYIFADYFHVKTLRMHLMVSNPKFGNFFSFAIEDGNWLHTSSLHVSVYFNESYWEKEYSSGVDRSWKLLTLPDLLGILRSKRLRKRWFKEYNAEQRAVHGLGALFG